MNLQKPSPDHIEIGIDEAGRGCLAGDVVAAAVIIPSDIENIAYKEGKTDIYNFIRDSKKMTPKRRESVYMFIQQYAIAWSTGSANVEEIDNMNIMKATQLAMHRSLEKLFMQYKTDQQQEIKLLVDGPFFKPYKNISYQCIENGDNKYMSIACASILAKVTRDHMIEKLCQDEPDLEKKYGIAQNKAYGTKKHLDGIKTYGVTKHHRTTFGPVKNSIFQFRF